MKKMMSFLFVVTFSSVTFASVTVHDNAGVIQQSSQNELITNGSRWPFDLRVLTGAFPSPVALDNAVHRCVVGPNVVCIGIDPVHHKTNVHIGTAIGVSSSELGTITSAGNSFFKTDDYRGGIEAIATRTASLAHITATPPSSTYIEQPVRYVDTPHTTSTGMGFGWWLFFALLIGAGAWVVIRARKTVKKINADMNDFRDEAFEMSSRNIETQEWHDKMKTKLDAEKHPMVPVSSKTATSTTIPIKTAQPSPVKTVSTPTSTPATVVHNHYGSPSGPNYNPSLTGSGATDMLLGYELGRMSSPVTPVVVTTPSPVIVERSVVRETIPVDAGGSSSNWDNDDAGGKISNWDTKSDDVASDTNDDSGAGGSSDWGSSSSSDSSSSNSDSGSSDWGGSSDSGSSSDSGGSSDW